jgi:hypothetical protein
MSEHADVTDEQVACWTDAVLSDDLLIADAEDIGYLAGEAAAQVYEHSANHLITQVGIWPVPGEPEALITLDLPNGIRLCTRAIRTRELIPGPKEAPDRPALIALTLGYLLREARDLADQYNTHAAQHPPGQDRTDEQDSGPGPLDRQVIDDILGRLGNRRPPEDDQYADMTGIPTLAEDDYYDRYEIGDPSILSRHGLTFPIHDTVTGNSYALTIQRQP